MVDFVVFVMCCYLLLFFRSVFPVDSMSWPQGRQFHLAPRGSILVVKWSIFVNNVARSVLSNVSLACKKWLIAFFLDKKSSNMKHRLIECHLRCLEIWKTLSILRCGLIAFLSNFWMRWFEFSESITNKSVSFNVSYNRRTKGFSLLIRCREPGLNRITAQRSPWLHG